MLILPLLHPWNRQDAEMIGEKGCFRMKMLLAHWQKKWREEPRIAELREPNRDADPAAPPRDLSGVIPSGYRVITLSRGLRQSQTWFNRQFTGTPL